MSLFFDYDLDVMKANQRTKYPRPFRSSVTIRTNA